MRLHAGITASLAAEAVFVLMVAAVQASLGQDPWRVVKVPAVFLTGPDAVEPSGFVATDVLLGPTAHAAFAVPIGVGAPSSFPDCDSRP